MFLGARAYAMCALCCMMQRYCADSEPEELFDCLRKNKEETSFDSKCRAILLERMRQKAQGECPRCLATIVSTYVHLLLRVLYYRQVTTIKSHEYLCTL